MSETHTASSSLRTRSRLKSASEDILLQSVTTTEAGSVNRALLHNDGTSRNNSRLNLDRSLSKGDRALRYWCYGLHLFLIVPHIVLVGMLFTHPERRFTISVNNTAATIALKAFLQGFYTVYTAVLVLVTRRLAISAAMSKRQTLTAVHDISGAWNGIGAAINTLWQQTKIVSAPATILVTLIYLGCISGLHIVSSSVVQFDAFNNTVTSSVPSTLAWPSASVDLAALSWETISPLLTLWPLLSTAKGLSGSTLYDVPSTGYAYAGAVVKATTLTAECGLLSNLSVGVLNTTLGNNTYNVNVRGLGEVGLPASELFNSVFFMELPGPNSTTNNNYIGYQVTTEIELGNLTHEVVQVTVNSTSSGGANFSITTNFVACTLNVTPNDLYLPMQNGKLNQNVSLPTQSSSGAWTIWSPGLTTNLTQAFNAAQQGLEAMTTYSSGPRLCQVVETPASYGECQYMSLADIYINDLLGIQWTLELLASSIEPSLLLVLSQEEMENAVAQLAATFIWLAGASGGFQQAQGKSLISNSILELRLNVNLVPVAIAFTASVTLLAIVVWMFHGPHLAQLKTSVTRSGVLELTWISAHSTIIQDLMRTTNISTPDQLRLRGMRAEVCLANLAFQPITYQGENNNLSEFEAYDCDQREFTTKGKPLRHFMCYTLHIILLAVHVLLIVLLKYHPENHVIMASDNTWVTTALSLSLQAFYTLYTAGLVFVTQQLAVSTIVTQQHYLTAVHDISQAWTSIGAAFYALWGQTKTLSSIWTILGVVIYLACASILHIASSTIMQFNAFNSTSIVLVQSIITWPNSTVLANGSWIGPNQIVTPNSLLQNLETTGLLNNTLYDFINTTDPTFTTAVVNVTSLQANCGLLSNLSFSNTGGTPSFNFFVTGLGSGNLLTTLAFQSEENQISFIGYNPTVNSSTECPLCAQYLFFLITTNVELDSSITKNTTGFTINISKTGDTPIMGYLAACSLLPQAGYGTLDLQTRTLVLAPSQTIQQPWKLWSPGEVGSSNLVTETSFVFDNTAFGVCPQSEYIGCSMYNASIPTQNSSFYTLTPNQLQQAIENSVAAMVWIGGQIGPKGEGFERATGENQVTQVTTKWRLHINEVPVLFTSVASLVMIIMVSWFIRVPSRVMKPPPLITGTSVLETLWIVAHSLTLYRHMAQVNDPSTDNLRREGMFQICLGDVQHT